MSDSQDPKTVQHRQPRGSVAISKGAAGTFGLGTTALIVYAVWQSGLFASSDRVKAIEENQVRIEQTISAAEERIIGHFDRRIDSLEKAINKHEDRQTRVDERQDRWIENLEFVVGIKSQNKNRVNR